MLKYYQSQERGEWNAKPVRVEADTAAASHISGLPETAGHRPAEEYFGDGYCGCSEYEPCCGKKGFGLHQYVRQTEGWI